MRFLLTLLCLLLIRYPSYTTMLGSEVNEKILDNIIFPVKEIAIVQLSFDGINTFHCGVGTVVLQTQKILKEINEQDKNCHIKLYLISGDYSNKLPEYSSPILKQNITVCSETGGDVYLIPISLNNQMFGEPDQWEELCSKGAELCAKIINDNSFTVIIAHDTAYAHVPLKLGELQIKNEINKPYRALWVPHATSWSYNGFTSEGLPKWPERHEWELTAFRQADRYGYKIGYISANIRNDITAYPFNVNESSLFFYQTGILLDPYQRSLPEKLISEELSKKSIPLDKKLIFSIGRANPLKGQDIILEVYRHIKTSNPDVHLVMLAPTSDYMPEYINILKQRIKDEQLEVTLIDQFDPNLAHFIYQWPQTIMIGLLSRADTQPLTVMEARINPTNSIVLVSDAGGMCNQVIHGVNGFVCSLEGLETMIKKPMTCKGSLQKIVTCAQEIIDLSNEKRTEIIEAGKRLIQNKYDLRKNMIGNIQRLFDLFKNPSESDSNSTCPLIVGDIRASQLVP